MAEMLISDEAMRAILSVADQPFKQTGIRQPDGQWRVPCNQGTLDRLTQMAHPGESQSDTIIRALAAMKGSIQ